MIVTISEGNVIQWRNMIRSTDRVPIFNAVVTVQIKTSSGTDVGPAVAMALVPNVRGATYRGVIPAATTALLDPTLKYDAHVTATIPGSEPGFRKIPLEVMYHREE